MILFVELHVCGHVIWNSSTSIPPSKCLKKSFVHASHIFLLHRHGAGAGGTEAANGVQTYGLFGCLKKEGGGDKVEGERVIQLPCLKVF